MDNLFNLGRIHQKVYDEYMPKGAFRVAITIIIFFTTIVAIVRFANFDELVNIARSGSITFILLAVLAHLFYILFQAGLINALFLMVNESLLLFEAALFYLGAEFANFILPTGGVAGFTVFITEAKKHDIPTSTAVTIGAISYYINYLTFSAVLGLGLLFLADHNELSRSYVVPSIIMGSIVLAATAVLWSASRGPRGVKRIIHSVVWIINHFSVLVRNKLFLTKNKIHEFSHGIHETINDLFDRPISFWKPITLGFLIHSMNIATFGLLFWAFHYPVTLGVILTGYAISWLTTIISITPSGVGFVEGATTLALKSFGVPLEVAVLVVTLYRAIVFWLPFVFGLLIFRRLKLFSEL